VGPRGKLSNDLVRLDSTHYKRARFLPSFNMWTTASIWFFGYVGVLACALPGVHARKRARAVAGTLVGLVTVAAAACAPAGSVLRDWVLPPAALLIAYWTTGLLFTAPMPRAERFLVGLDRRADVRGVAARTPRWLAELLEVAYVGVYPIVPIGLALFLAFDPRPDPARFWDVILITDYICFGVLPWVQTRPPRCLESAPPWDAMSRRLNLRLVGSASIGVNTFPSGHAAEALAVALLVGCAPWPISVVMLLVALAISAGAVLGRYHFLADAAAGWIVAIVVWRTIG
jgi:membrane-associated phospholipid phosphatase